MLQRVDFRRGVPVEFQQTDAATAKQWVEELEAGDWKRASISHVQKLARRLAHLAREVEANHGKAAAAELWAYKKRAERVGNLVAIRESNVLHEGFSEHAVAQVMEGHAALVTGTRPRESEEKS
jgi:hypothetical protein